MADLGAVGQQGLLTENSSDVGQASPWDNNGAQSGLLTFRTDLYLDLPWDNNGAQQGLLTKRTNQFPPQPPPAQPTPPAPAAAVFKAAVCTQKINCECPELPLENLSSEDLDVPVFCATVTIREEPPLGVCGPDLTNTRICCSEESQDDAYLCALKLAQEQTWSGWGGGTCPPPDEPTPNCPPFCAPPPCPPCDSNCPPNCPPPPPFAFIVPNETQSCEVTCADGGTFFWTIPAGSVTAVGIDPVSAQLQANYLANSLACKLAKQNKICFTTTTLEDGCEDQQYVQQVVARGGRPFITPFIDQNTLFIPDECIGLGLADGTIVPYQYQILFGALPPGLTLNCFGYIRGTPTLAGNYTFTIQINDANGVIQSKEFTITIEDCDADNYGEVTPDISSSARSYWNSADSIPAGTYKISYINGAVRYNASGEWWLNHDNTSMFGGYRISYNDGAADVVFPGTASSTDGTHFFSQAEVEAGNSGRSITINHTGGRIAMYLSDNPYTDNLPGSPNPTFNLTSV